MSAAEPTSSSGGLAERDSAAFRACGDSATHLTRTAWATAAPAFEGQVANDQFGVGRRETEVPYQMQLSLHATLVRQLQQCATLVDSQ